MGLCKPKSVVSGQWLVVSNRTAVVDRHYPLSTSHYPLSSHWPLTTGHSRRAFTLIEMLIVVSIVLILMAVAVTMIRPANESRRVREAARAINVYLSSARNLAMETGRPCGVMFHCFGTASATQWFAMNVDQREVPPPYAGDTEDSVVAVNRSGASPPVVLGTTLTTWTGTTGTFSAGMVHRGDLMQLNNQGPLYTINANTATDADPIGGSLSTLTLRPDPNSASSDVNVPWPVSPVAGTVPYRILRSPAKGGATPLQLPAATVVDLGASSVGVNAPFGANDVTILFSPNGGVDRMYVGNVLGVPVDPIYLLVGKRERVGAAFTSGSSTNEAAFPNYQDLGNLWITINPLSGLINTEPLAAIAAGVSDPAVAIGQSRALAGTATGMGGK
jgi:prepilin-type N-terminal cleavage/methylation domain-containing protein